MKKILLVMAAGLSLAAMACTSVESAKVNSADIASSSDAVAVIQTTELNLNLL